MPTHLQDSGFVIRQSPLTETSLIIHWLTKDHGIVKTVAKGARRPKSPFAGKIDLFVEGHLNWITSRTKSDLHTLSEVDVKRRRQDLARSYPTTLLASYFCQLLDLLLEPDHPVPELHSLLTRGLAYLEKETPTQKALRHFENQAALLLGIADSRTNGSRAIQKALGFTPKIREKCLNSLD